MPTHRVALALLVAAVLSPLAAPTTAAVAAGSAPGTPAKPFDFNGDGRADVATGMPSWDAGGAPVGDSARVSDSGAVLVLWGGRDRVEETFLTQASPGVPGDPANNENFGQALASADFDRDGFADLAVGAPFDAFEQVADGYAYGSVTILYGSGFGLGDRVEQISHGAHSGFGAALTAADFTGDGYADLAVGATGDDPRPEADYGSGAVVLLQGGPAGFALARSSTISRPDPAMAAFGAVLASGDLDGDGRADLVEGFAGVPDYVDDPATPGHTTYALGSEQGPRTATPLGVRAAASLAVGDLNRDGFDDVVVGTPVRRPYTEDQPVPRGRITVFHGSATGPEQTGVALTQASRGVPGSDEHGDLFGAAVALSDVDRDGRLDLLVGAPGENRGAGRVTLVRGTRSGFATRGNVVLDQARPGIEGRPERRDRFGAELSTLDVTGDSRQDIVVGIPGENGSRGAVLVVRLKGIFYTDGSARTFSLRSLHRAGDGARPAFGSVVG